MFENLQKNVGKKSSETRRNRKELPRTVAFLSALAAHDLRLSYAALAEASEALGEHTPSGLSAGQRGSQIVKNLPERLQPLVCRSNGGYQKGTEWKVDGETITAQTMKKLDYVLPSEIHAYVEAFVKSESPATAEPEVEPTLENDVPTGLESEDDPTDEIEIDESID